MDGDWFNWIPRHTPSDKEVTPESFSESLWHLASGPVNQETSESKIRPPSAQERNFKFAPESIRKAWIDSESDPLFPSQSLKAKTSFSFGITYSQNKRTEAINAPAQQSTMVPFVNSNMQQVYSTLAISPNNIQANGTAPIGSEMQQLRQRQITYPEVMGGDVVGATGFAFPQINVPNQIHDECIVQQAGAVFPVYQINSLKKPSTNSLEHSTGIKQDGNNNTIAPEEGASDKSFHTLCGVSLKAFNEQKAATAALQEGANKTAGDNSSGEVKLSNGGKEVKPSSLAKEPVSKHSRKSSSNSSTATIKPSTKPPATIARYLGTFARRKSISSTSSSMIAETGNSPPHPLQKPAITFSSHTRTGSEDTVITVRSGASEHDEFFNPPTGAKEQFQLAKAKFTSDMALTTRNSFEATENIITSEEQAVGPPAMNNMAFGLMSQGPAGPAPRHIMFRRDLSSEELAALQAQSFQAGQQQLAMAYERDIQAMMMQHKDEMEEKDYQLMVTRKALDVVKRKLADLQKRYDTDVDRMAEKFQAMQKMVDQYGKQSKALTEDFNKTKEELAMKIETKQNFAMSDVTPTNQVVFMEPATHAHPIREQPAPLSAVTTPENQIALVQPAGFTFPGANHPAHKATYTKAGYDSPEYVTRQRHSANGLGVNKPFDDKEWDLQVNVADDVFDDPTMRKGNGLKFFFTTIGYEQKGLHEALSVCFGRVEHAVRLSPLVRMTGHVLSDAVRSVITLCQEHIEHRAEVYSMLAHKDEKYLLLSGVINSLITEKVFREATVTEFECMFQATMKMTWDAEEESRKDDVANTARRAWFGRQRAEIANHVVQVDGFWRWVRDYTNTVLDSIMPKIQAAFPKNYHAALRQHLWAPVNDAVRLVVRIRQDPRYFEYHFQRVGCTWDNRYMVARNPDLVGQALDNVRTPYVTRCTARPLIKVKNFDGFDGTDSTIHKSEVLLSERKNTLRPMGRPGQYAQRGGRRQR